MANRYCVSLDMEHVQVSKQYINELHWLSKIECSETFHNSKREKLYSFISDDMEKTTSNKTPIEERPTTELVMTTKQEIGIQYN